MSPSIHLVTALVICTTLLDVGRELIPVNDDQGHQDSGEFDTKYDRREIVQFVELNEPVTTQDVADEFECHRNTARYRLKNLAEKDILKKHQKGPNHPIVWSGN